MSYKVTDNTEKIIVKTDLAIETAIRLALEDIVRIAEPNTPKKTGKLRTSATVLANQGVVNWTVPYAGIQENTQYENYTTPGTGPHFAADAVKVAEGKFDIYLKEAGVI